MKRAGSIKVNKKHRKIMWVMLKYTGTQSNDCLECRKVEHVTFEKCIHSCQIMMLKGDWILSLEWCTPMSTLSANLIYWQTFKQTILQQCCVSHNTLPHSNRL